VVAEKEQHAAKLLAADAAFTELMALKEAEEAVAAAKVNEQAHQVEQVCSDAMRHLDEDYLSHYHCRFDAAITAPNPLVAYDVRATMSDGKQNDPAAELEARKAAGAKEKPPATSSTTLQVELHGIL